MNASDILYIRSAEESLTVEKIKSDLGFSTEEAKIILDSLRELSPSPQFFSYHLESNSHGFALGFVIMVGKYSININKLAIFCLSCLLGFTPFSGVFSLIEKSKELQGIIVDLTNSEKVLYIFLKQFSHYGETDLTIDNIVRCFKKSEKEKKGVRIVNDDIKNMLDSLNKKGLIEINTRTVKVKV